MTDAASVTKAARRTLDAFGQIDLLVANAGSFGAIGPVWEVDPDRWWTDVTTNVRGTFLSCRAVLPAMIARGQGTIVTLRGGGWDRPFRHGSGYASSKAAIVRFTDTLAAEVAPHGIGVYSLGPGLVRTAMTEIQLQSPEGRRWFGRAQEWFARGDDVPPSEAARVAVFLASLPHTKLSGRVIGTNDDLDWIATHVDDIVAEDLLVLRGRRPPG